MWAEHSGNQQLLLTAEIQKEAEGFSYNVQHKVRYANDCNSAYASK